MKELPERRMESYKRERVKVELRQPDLCGSQCWLLGAESADRRASGGAALYLDRVEVWYGQRKASGDAALAWTAPSTAWIIATSLIGWYANRELLPHYRYQ